MNHDCYISYNMNHNNGSLPTPHDEIRAEVGKRVAYGLLSNKKFGKEVTKW